MNYFWAFVVGGGIMIALAFLLDDYSIDPSNFGMNTPVAAFFKTVGGAAFGYMLPILAGFIAMSIADRPGLAVGFAGGVLAMNGTNFAGLANGETTGISGGFLAALLAGFVAGYVVEFLKKITEKLPASLNGIRPMLIYPLGGILIIGAVMCGINPVMGMINTAMTNWLNAMGGTSKVLLGAIVAGMMSIDMGGPFTRRLTSSAPQPSPPATMRSWPLSWWAAWCLPSPSPSPPPSAPRSGPLTSAATAS